MTWTDSENAQIQGIRVADFEFAQTQKLRLRLQVLVSKGTTFGGSGFGLRGGDGITSILPHA